MVSNTIKIRPRYHEVDKMGYVYHANYLSYCHQARTELMREFGICDALIESKGFMMPVISFDIKYKKPVGYDEELFIKTTIVSDSKLKLIFHFDLLNKGHNLVGEAHSEVVIVDSNTRKPLRIPLWIMKALNSNKSIVAL